MRYTATVNREVTTITSRRPTWYDLFRHHPAVVDTDAVLLTQHQQILPRRECIAFRGEPEVSGVDVARVNLADFGL